MEFKQIKSDRLYLKVAKQLTSLITDEKIKPGERFPSERELAERLGVSRPVIREAMIAMELSGVIEVRTGSGIYVAERLNTPVLIDKGIGPFEILEARMLFETEACALAATRISAEQINALKHTVSAMKEEQVRPDASERADRTFHCVLAEASQNSAVLSTVRWLWDLRDQSSLSNAFLERIREEGVHPSIEEHENIIAALETGDPEAARQAMKQHLERATAAAATYFENN